MAYGSTFDSGEGVFWDTDSDPALDDLAAKSVAVRERAGCRRCGAAECAYCAAPVRREPGNLRVPLCHYCSEATSGPSTSEINEVTGAAAPITMPCERRDRRLAAS